MARRKLIARWQQLEVGAVVEGAAPVGELGEGLPVAVRDVVACPEHDIDLGQPPAYGARRKLAEPIAVHLEDEPRPGDQTPRERKKLAHVLDMDDVRVEFREASQPGRRVAVRVERHPLKLAVGQVEAAQHVDYLSVGGVASRVAPGAGEDVSDSLPRTLREVGMAKRADGHVEATLLIRRKLVSEVVDDASDRAPGNRKWDGQVLLREEPNADALSGNVGAMSIARRRSNVAHASHRNPLLAICRRPGTRVGGLASLT